MLPLCSSSRLQSGKSFRSGLDQTKLMHNPISVRREDIYRSSTPSEDSEDDSLLRERQSKLDEVFASIAPLATVDVACADHDGRQEDAERSEFEFRLFSGPISTSAITAPSIGASKINIRTPTPDIQNTGFIVPHRPGSFYVARRLPAEEREQIATAAVTGEDVQRRAGEPCVGTKTLAVLNNS